MIDFGNRVVLITGAAGGIGAATARTIAGCGGHVVLHDAQPRPGSPATPPAPRST